MNSTGDNEINSLVIRFLEGVRLRIARMNEALVENDRQNLAGFSHQLKGTAMSYGFTRLAELASLIEQRASLAEEAWVIEQLEEMKVIVETELSQYRNLATPSQIAVP